MPSQITNYQCPTCGGPLHFDADAQQVKCDHCGSLFSIDEITAAFQEKNEQAAAQGTSIQSSIDTLQWSEEEKQHLRAYSCPSCGAQLICDENTAATSCPYCGNPTVVPAQFEGALKPDYLIPFKLSKEEAVDRLKNYYRGKPFLPRAFSAHNHIEEIKGVYVPFWLYDGTADVSLEFHGTRSRSYSDGDYIVTDTDHFKVERDGSVTFNKVPADASSKLPDEIMDALEPYDYEEMVDFEMSYLPGYLADKYDITYEENEQRVDIRMRNSAIDAIEQTAHGYQTLANTRSFINIVPNKVHYAFFPVWLLTTKWKGENHLFAMNGQTGKYVGDLPVDMLKFWLYFIAITIGLICLFALILFGLFM